MVIGSIYRPLVPVSGRAFCYNETEKNKKTAADASVEYLLLLLLLLLVLIRLLFLIFLLLHIRLVLMRWWCQLQRTSKKGGT